MSDNVRLVADIGGTHARFALVNGAMRPYAMRVLACAQYASLAAAASDYLAEIDGPMPRAGACAMAMPITGDRLKMTNNRWEFSVEETRQQLGFEHLLVLNDFTALAWSLPHLGPEDKRQVGGGAAIGGAAIGVIGPGTGLGVSGLIPAGRDWVALQGEGGHVTLSPADAREAKILEIVWREHTHVSVERLVSGMGMGTLHRAVAEVDGLGYTPLEPADITARALAGTDAACVATMETFCAMLGTAAGNVALTLGARGGVYIGGGIVPRLGVWFDRSPFRSRFEAKGRFAAYNATIPTYVIQAAAPALVGAAWALESRLRALGG